MKPPQRECRPPVDGPARAAKEGDANFSHETNRIRQKPQTPLKAPHPWQSVGQVFARVTARLNVDDGGEP